MYLLNSKLNSTPDCSINDVEYLNFLRQPGEKLKPNQIKVGGFYLYKEKFGMVAVVKVLKDTSESDWVGFRLMVKQVLYSCWNIPKGAVFDVGCNLNHFKHHTSWQLEPSLSLLKSQNPMHLHADNKNIIESVL